MTAAQIPVRKHAGAIGDRWLDLLREMVDLNSGFTNQAGQERMFGILAGHFARLGFEARAVALAKGRKAMIFEWPEAAPEVLLVGHVDTMFQPDSPFQSLQEKDGVLTGPGISDMKAGLVLILMLLERLGEPALLRRVRIFINDDEELGARYSRQALKAETRDLRFALIFEPGLTDGSYVLGCSLAAPCDGGGHSPVPRTIMRYYGRDEAGRLAQDLCEMQLAFRSGAEAPPAPAALQRLPDDRLCRSGCVMVVGLGPYGGKTHTTEEFLRPETFAERLAAAELMLESLLNAGARPHRAVQA